MALSERGDAGPDRDEDVHRGRHVGCILDVDLTLVVSAPVVPQAPQAFLAVIICSRWTSRRSLSQLHRTIHLGQRCRGPALIVGVSGGKH